MPVGAERRSVLTFTSCDRVGWLMQECFNMVVANSLHSGSTDLEGMWKTLEDHKGNIGAVVLDWNMVGKHTPELVNVWKSAGFSDTPIIIITHENLSREERFEVNRSLADAVITVPSTAGDYIKEIQKALGEKISGDLIILPTNTQKPQVQAA
jgi:DNA-binding response OmpR family regulator